MGAGIPGTQIAAYGNTLPLKLCQGSSLDLELTFR